MKKIAFALLLLTATYASFAEDNEVTEPTEPATPATVIVDKSGLESPRETIKTFLQSMADVKNGQSKQIKVAITTLDLSKVNSLIREQKGRDLAWMLLEVIDKTKIVNLRAIPPNTDGQPYVFSKYKNGSLSINKLTDGRWLFSQDTLTGLPSILEELANKKSLQADTVEGSYVPWQVQFRQQLPHSLKTRTFLLENWKWLGILFIIAAGVIADKVTAFLLQVFLNRFRKNTHLVILKDSPDDLLRPLAMLVMAGIWLLGINQLALPDQAMIVLLVAVKILAGAAAVWSAYRLVDLVTIYLHHQANKTDNKVDDVLVPLISKTLKLFVTVVGITFVASNLDLNVSSLLASLGLGGLAFALAAKDVVQNLFGSVTVIMDQTFHTGDWIVVDNIEGSVEEVGLRSTKIRTFYNSLITLPNSIFINAKVDNMGNRRYRRLKCNVSLTYDTPPDKIEAFCEGVRELVRLHPYMRKDYYHVYLNSLGASSLDVLVYVFWETPDWSTELRERHRFLLDVLRLAKAQQVNIAFPTQTLHLLTEADNKENLETRSSSNSPSVDNLSEQFKTSAKNIVTQSTGIDTKPPPVKF